MNSLHMVFICKSSTRFVTIATTLDLFQPASEIEPLEHLLWGPRAKAKAAALLARKASTWAWPSGGASFPANLSFFLKVSRGFFWPFALCARSFLARSDWTFATSITCRACCDC